MIHSMTGYGKAAGQAGKNFFQVELRSLNSKFFEISLKIPSVLRTREAEMRLLLQQMLDRGKIDVLIVPQASEIVSVEIDRKLAMQYHSEVKKLAEELNEPLGNLLPLILQLPDVVGGDKTDFDEKEWNELKQLILEAANNLQHFRITEGKNLDNDLKNRLKLIADFLPELAPVEEERLARIRKRLTKSLEEFVSAFGIDQNRLEQEMVYYIEKLDISEEKTRLQSHIEYFRATMDGKESQGKKLNFIAQEMGREINTIGAKANDAAIQKIVVQMKDELEKIREQINNIL